MKRLLTVLLCFFCVLCLTFLVGCPWASNNSSNSNSTLQNNSSEIDDTVSEESSYSSGSVSNDSSSDNSANESTASSEGESSGAVELKTFKPPVFSGDIDTETQSVSIKFMETAKISLDAQALSYPADTEIVFSETSHLVDITVSDLQVTLQGIGVGNDTIKGVIKADGYQDCPFSLAVSCELHTIGLSAAVYEIELKAGQTVGIPLNTDADDCEIYAETQDKGFLAVDVRDGFLVISARIGSEGRQGEVIVTADKFGYTSESCTVQVRVAEEEESSEPEEDNQPSSETSDESSSGSDNESSSSNSNDNSQVSGSYAQQILQLVNEERAKYDLAPLSLSSSLCNAAQQRAVETTSLFEHTRPNGSSCFTVLDDYNIRYYSCAENIAYGHKSAAQVVEAWMNSAGHRTNILNSSYTTLGVGVAEKNGVLYWVQLFVG